MSFCPRLFAASLAVVAVVGAGSPVFASSSGALSNPGGAYQGYSGGTSAPQDSVAPTNSTTAAPSADSSSAPPSETAATPAPEDPCAAYAANPPAHVICRDRLEKIQRMKAAATQRDENLKAYYKKLERRTVPVAQEESKKDAEKETDKDATKEEEKKDADGEAAKDETKSGDSAAAK